MMLRGKNLPESKSLLKAMFKLYLQKCRFQGQDKTYTEIWIVIRWILKTFIFNDPGKVESNFVFLSPSGNKGGAAPRAPPLDPSLRLYLNFMLKF